MSRCRWSASTTARLATTTPSTSRPVVVTTRATCSTVLTALSSCARRARRSARLTNSSRAGHLCTQFPSRLTGHGQIRTKLQMGSWRRSPGPGATGGPHPTTHGLLDRPRRTCRRRSRRSTVTGNRSTQRFPSTRSTSSGRLADRVGRHRYHSTIGSDHVTTERVIDSIGAVPPGVRVRIHPGSADPERRVLVDQRQEHPRHPEHRCCKVRQLVERLVRLGAEQQGRFGRCDPSRAPAAGSGVHQNEFSSSLKQMPVKVAHRRREQVRRVVFRFIQQSGHVVSGAVPEQGQSERPPLTVAEQVTVERVVQQVKRGMRCAASL